MPIGGLGFGEMVLIFAVLLLLFGAKRLPELASGMGRGIRDFKRALNGVDENSIQANQPAAAVQPPQQAAQVQAAPAPAEVEAKRDS
jgi:sec-independent protein translocase protein TatA